MNPCTFESLELRTHLSVSQDTNGWTQFIPSRDSNVVYVSSSTGNDANSGSSPEQAVATLEKGYSLMRDGMPDWLLIKRGDRFNTPLGGQLWNQPGVYDWTKSGRSQSEPMLISTYGTGARPVLETGGKWGFDVSGGGTHGHLALVGVELDGNGQNAGVRINTSGSDFLIEDVTVKGYQDDMELMAVPGAAPLSNIRVRRSNILDSWINGTAHSQGIYAEKIGGLLLEENLFDHNGWKQGVQAPTIFNHNIYAKDVQDLVVRGNTIANASSFGLLINGDSAGAASSPLVENNLFLANGNNIALGTDASHAITNAVVRNNVFTRTGRVIDGTDQSFGVDIGSVDGLSMTGNLFLDKSDPGTSFIARLHFGKDPKNITISSNTAYNWNGGQILVENNAYSNILIQNNTLQDNLYSSQLVVDSVALPAPGLTFSGNVYWSNLAQNRWFVIQDSSSSPVQWVAASGEMGARIGQMSFADASRTIGTYDSLIGGAGTAADFLSQARLRAIGTWNAGTSAAMVDQYLMQGFVATATPPPIVDSPASMELDSPMVVGATLVRNGVDLGWNAVAGATGYQVDRSYDGKNWSMLATTSSPSYQNAGLDWGTTYYYRVRASSSGSISENSPVLRVTTPAALASGAMSTAAAAPTGLAAQATSPNVIGISWDAVAGATAYQLDRSYDGKSWSTVAKPASTSFVNIGMDSATTYYYRVRAVSGASVSASSAAVSVTTPSKVAAAVPNISASLSSPAGFTAVAVTAHIIDVNWSAVSGATSYRLERSYDGAHWSAIATVSGTSFENIGMDSNTACFYRVFAVDSSGSSVSSGIVKIQTPAA